MWREVLSCGSEAAAHDIDQDSFLFTVSGQVCEGCRKTMSSLQDAERSDSAMSDRSESAPHAVNLEVAW